MKVFIVLVATGVCIWGQATSPPIQITQAEKADIAESLVKIQKYQDDANTLNSNYNKILSDIQAKLQAAQTSLNKTLADIKKNHKCETCQLTEDLELLKPVTTPTPTPTPTKPTAPQK